MQQLARGSMLALIVSSTLWQSPATAVDSNWVEQSNAYAQIVMESVAKFSPEAAASMGVDGLDEQITDLKPERYQRGLADSQELLVELEKRLTEETDSRVRQDLGILIKTTKDGMRSSKLNRDQMLPYTNLTRSVFQGVRGLIDPQIARPAVAGSRCPHQALCRAGGRLCTFGTARERPFH